MQNNNRAPEHKKDHQLEELLKYFETLLSPLEKREINKIALCDEPIVYIMGCARSGTTLVYQYLSYSGIFTYPTNFLSRFYYAPFLGALLQKMLIQLDFMNEIFSSAAALSFESKLGKTKGAMAPHEFWYFWYRFFSFDDIQELKPSDLRKIDGEGFIRELKAFQSMENRPLLLKGMILNWHIPFLADLFSNTYFIFVKRSLQSNAYSLANARQDFFNDSNQWYSFKPRGYKKVLDLEPLCQCIWQVLETNAAIEEGLSYLLPSRFIKVNYEDFCENPLILLNDISKRLEKPIPQKAASLPTSFEVRPTPKLPKRKLTQILKEIKPFNIRHNYSIDTKNI